MYKGLERRQYLDKLTHWYITQGTKENLDHRVIENRRLRQRIMSTDANPLVESLVRNTCVWSPFYSWF